MANETHKGTELNNVKETWNQNEKLREEVGSDTSATDSTDAPPATKLEEIVKQEASEYDNENKENRILGGDRATLDDDDSGS